jgi:hypothetical protein
VFPPELRELKNKVLPSIEIKGSIASKVKPVIVTFISGPKVG